MPRLPLLPGISIQPQNERARGEMFPVLHGRDVPHIPIPQDPPAKGTLHPVPRPRVKEPLGHKLLWPHGREIRPGGESHSSLADRLHQVKIGGFGRVAAARKAVSGRFEAGDLTKLATQDCGMGAETAAIVAGLEAAGSSEPAA